MAPQNVLQVSLDTEHVNHLEAQLEEKNAEGSRLKGKLVEMETLLKNVNVELEEKRKEWKVLEQRKNYKAKAAARIETVKRNLRKAMAEANLDQERMNSKSSVEPCVRQMVQSLKKLQEAIGEVQEGQRDFELVRLANLPMEEMVEQKQAALDTARESLQGLKREVDTATRELEESMQALSIALREAKASTGSSGKEPPPDVVARWKAEQFPDGREAIDVMMSELKAEAECMDSVDPQTVRDYKLLKENVDELTNDISRRKQQKMESEEQMEQIKTDWLQNLTNLVSRINNRFSAHFASLGFAGQVELHRGKHDYDFENYGVNILVKYRDTEPLQKLTPHHQVSQGSIGGALSLSLKTLY